MTDDAGVLHEIWAVHDPAAIEALCLAVSASPVVLADGHHRYSVARRYRDEQTAAHDGVNGPYDFVMALIVELEGGLERGTDPLCARSRCPPRTACSTSSRPGPTS